MRNVLGVFASSLRALLSVAAALLCPIEAMADSYSYMQNGNTDFGVIDLTTGAYTSCGESGTLLSGMGVGLDHNIYGGAVHAGTFYRVSPANGTLKEIGQSTIQYALSGSTLTNFYAMDFNNNLYTVDIASGATTLIGPAEVDITGSGVFGMSTNSKTLFVTHNSTLYKMNLKNGKAVLVGTATSGTLGAEVTEGGALYAGSESPFAVYKLDPKTGAATELSAVTGSGSNSFWALIPIKATHIPINKICADHPR